MPYSFRRATEEIVADYYSNGENVDMTNQAILNLMRSLLLANTIVSEKHRNIYNGGMFKTDYICPNVEGGVMIGMTAIVYTRGNNIQRTEDDKVKLIAANAWVPQIHSSSPEDCGSAQTLRNSDYVFVNLLIRGENNVPALYTGIFQYRRITNENGEKIDDYIAQGSDSFNERYFIEEAIDSELIRRLVEAPDTSDAGSLMLESAEETLQRSKKRGLNNLDIVLQEANFTIRTDADKEFIERLVKMANETHNYMWVPPLATAAEKAQANPGRVRIAAYDSRIKDRVSFFTSHDTPAGALSNNYGHYGYISIRIGNEYDLVVRLGTDWDNEAQEFRNLRINLKRLRH